MSKRQGGIDPAVAGLLVQAESRRAGRNGGELKKQKVNLNLPASLTNAIRAEAFALTGHKRRGFSDLVIVLLRHGWAAYQAGELKIEMQPVAVEMKIAAVKK